MHQLYHRTTRKITSSALLPGRLRPAPGRRLATWIWLQFWMGRLMMKLFSLDLLAGSTPDDSFPNFLGVSTLRHWTGVGRLGSWIRRCRRYRISFWPRNAAYSHWSPAPGRLTITRSLSGSSHKAHCIAVESGSFASKFSSAGFFLTDVTRWSRQTCGPPPGASTSDASRYHSGRSSAPLLSTTCAPSTWMESDFTVPGCIWRWAHPSSRLLPLGGRSAEAQYCCHPALAAEALPPPHRVGTGFGFINWSTAQYRHGSTESCPRHASQTRQQRRAIGGMPAWVCRQR